MNSQSVSELKEEQRTSLRSVLLGIADDELIMGHRHSEWTGWAPHIEEDIAFSSIAQDEIGHANLYYQLIAELDQTSVDMIALGRTAGQYTNAVICERPNRDWAFTLARHFLYEVAERIRLESFRSSSFKPLADASAKLLNEERYHEMHADAWLRRLASGPVEGRTQLETAIGDALGESAGLFEPYQLESEALGSGFLPSSSMELLHVWLEEVCSRIEDAGLPFNISPAPIGEVVPTASGALMGDASSDESVPAAKPAIQRKDGLWIIEGPLPGSGGRLGQHSAEFQDLWDDLTRTYREEPQATW
ncbi:MAG TPA: 1,2-phenylacetyl-CoA epoxidase subunit PaaC [Actinomycetota bacterium]|nr:1,2-phenylacetyl-CoA epoxidase subunit PaaC [Actinomycetota bacterium]